MLPSQRLAVASRARVCASSSQVASTSAPLGRLQFNASRRAAPVPRAERRHLSFTPTLLAREESDFPPSPSSSSLFTRSSVARASQIRAFATSTPAQNPRWVNGKTRPGQENEEGEGEGEGEGEKDSKREPEKPENERTPAEKGVAKSEGEARSSSGVSGGAAAAGGSSSSGSGSSSGSSSGSAAGSSSSSTSISRQTVPSVYPQVLALPITRRPLFPGFYKAVVIKNPAVCAAIKESLNRGQPYIGAFLLKDEEDDADVIADLSKVHRVGVFAQVTSVFPANGGKSEDGKEEGITAVLYPHRRIRIDELITPNGQTQPAPPLGTEDADPVSPVPEVNVDTAESKAATIAKVHEIQEQAREEGVIQQKNDATPDSPAVVKPPAEDKADGDKEAMPSHNAPFQTSFLQDYAVSLVNVTNLATAPFDKKNNSYIKAVMAELINVFKDIAQLNPLFRDQIANFSVSQGAGNVFEEPEKLADFAAAVSAGEVGELQTVLEALNVEDRLQKALVVLKKELMNAQLQSKISKDVESKIQKRQREYYLMEQLKGIKKELGIETDGKDKMVEKFKEKAAELRMPESVRKTFDEELSKLQTLEPAASEFNVTRGYLEWLTNIPWGVHSPENYSIANATTVLDEDHYGLKEVKDRILEFLAVGKLRGTVEGKIICLVGPPGVGKTSIGKSIARAVERQFFRFSVGGLSDVAEIKGHRRTYVGAMPGKAIQALKKVGTENPLVLIDEVDKIGRGHNGDPSSALLEMLDPEQNSSFLDHYMDVPVDLSRVLFVCTANTLDTIPQPLLDRMEVMEVSSYTAEEKRHIARGYLAPQAKEASGLKEANVELPDETIEFIIRHHARESGVRNLRKILEKVYRKIAFNIVRDHGEKVFPEPQEGELSPSDPPPEPAAASSAAPNGLASTPGGTDSAAQSVTPPPTPDAASDAAEGAPKENTGTVEKQEGKGSETPASASRKVTTEQRKPMAVPPEVKVVITPESLRDYLGPPVYHKDRLYVKSPPAGVSTGLGYLGNGSGSVMVSYSGDA